MRSELLALSFCILTLWASVAAHQAVAQTTQSQGPAISTSQSAASVPPTANDPQAVSITNQAIAAAGGALALQAISDYKAIGAITYHAAHDTHGAVTVLVASGLEQFRLDANLPTGLRSQVIDGELAVKAEDGTVWKPHYNVPISPGHLVLPQLLLSYALNSPVIGDGSGYTLLYIGSSEVDGRQVHDVQVQLTIPASADPDRSFRRAHSVDFLIDTATLQVVMTRDSSPAHSDRVVRYSDYRSLNGVLIPFSISESASGYLQSWLIQLDSVTFNAGLQSSDFQF